jgi:O-antigen/teichoic acid export membrane protein
MIFTILVAPEYRSVSWLLPGMVLAGALFATGQFGSLSLMIEKTTKKLIAPKIITAIIGVCLNVIGAKIAGIIGVVAANIAFSSLYLLWVLGLVRKRTRALCSHCSHP